MAIGTPASLGSLAAAVATTDVITLTLTAGAAVGDKVIVQVGSSTVNRVLNSVTDSRGNTYTIDLVSNGGTASVNGWIASTEVSTALAVNDTITATFASSLSSSRSISACSVTGLADTTPVDQSAQEEDAAGSDFATPSITTTVADTLIVGFGHKVSAHTITFDAPWTELFDISGGSRSHAVGYDIKSATGTFNVTGTFSGAGAKKELIVAYKGAAAAQTVTLAQALETDLAQSVSVKKTRALGLALETDTALPLTVAKAVPLGIATETDTAFGLTLSKKLALGFATETDTALPLQVGKTVTLGQAVETDTALALVTEKTLTLGIAVETDQALPLVIQGGSGSESPSYLLLRHAG